MINHIGSTVRAHAHGHIMAVVLIYNIVPIVLLCILHELPSLYVFMCCILSSRLQKQIFMSVRLCTAENESRRNQSTETGSRANSWRWGVTTAGALLGLGSFLIFDTQRRKVRPC